MGGNNMPMVLESNQNHATAKDTEVVNALPASMGMGGGYVPMIVESYGLITKGNGDVILSTEKHMSLSTGGGQKPMVVEPIIFTPDTYMKIDNGGGIAYSLLERDYKDAQCVVIQDAESNRNA